MKNGGLRAGASPSRLWYIGRSAPLSLQVLAVVLLGALLHASWNMLVKARPDKHVATAVLYTSSGLIAAALLPLLPAPDAASWPFLAVSTVLELLYGIVLATAYRVGDLSHAYPLMRGAAPLLVAAASSTFLGERLSDAVWLGIALLVVRSDLPGVRGPIETAAVRRDGLALLQCGVDRGVHDDRRGRVSAVRACRRLWLLAVHADRRTLVHMGGGGASARWLGKDTLRHAHRSALRRILAGFLCARSLGDDAGADRVRRGRSRDIDRFRHLTRRVRAS